MRKDFGIAWDFREPQATSRHSSKPSSLLGSTSLIPPSAHRLLTRKTRRPVSQKLEVEPIEPRILLSADLSPFAVAMLADQNDLTLSYDSTSDLIQVHETLTGDLVAEQLRAETSSVEILGTDGDDRLVMDMAGSYILPGGMYFDGGGGSDTLVGPGFDSTWIVDGVDSGSVEGLNFESVEALEGAAGNEDVFRLVAGGQSTGGLEGGDGGFDTVEIDAGGLPVVSSPTGPASGSLTVAGLETVYDGFEPVSFTAAPNVVLDFGIGADTVNVSFNGGTNQIVVSGPGMETHVIANAAGNNLTINLGGGSDVITVTGIEGTELEGNLTINGEGGDDTFNLQTGHGDMTITGGDDNDQINITGATTTTILGNTVATVDGAGLNVVNVTDIGDVTVTSDATAQADANVLISRVDSVFATLKNILGNVEDITELATSLPLIGGSTLADQAQVTLARAFDFVEAAENARANVVAAIEEALSDGSATISELQTAIEDISTTIAGLGPAVISGKIPSASDFTALGPADVFKVDLSFDIETTNPDFTVTSSTKNLTITIPESSLSSLTTLVDAINAQLLADENFAGVIQAVTTNGRLAFEVGSGDLTAFSVVKGAGDTVADTLFGFGAAVKEITTEIEERLRDLGDMALELENVLLGIANDGSIALDFEVIATRSTEFAFDFGTEAEGLGLTIDGAGRLTVDTGFYLDAEFELGVSSGFTGSITGLGAGLEISEGTVSVEASVGLISGTAAGSVALDGAVFSNASFAITEATTSIAFAPSVQGFDFSELTGATPLNAFTGVGTDSYAVTLTFTVGDDLIEVGGSALTSIITISGSDVFNGIDPTITVDTNFTDFLSDFNNFTPTDIAKTLADFILWIEDATQSSLLSDIELPFVGGSVADLARLGEMLSNQFLFDYGGDGSKDRDDKLVVDLNAAFQQAGLDGFIRAVGFGDSIEISIIDDDVAQIQFADSTDLNEIGWNSAILAAASPLSLSAAGFLAGKVAAMAAKFRILFKDGSEEFRDFEVSLETLENNVGIGDDAPKLIDAFNAPTFDSVQEFLKRLSEIGLLPSSLGDLSQYYDTVEDQLTFDINITEQLFDTELPVDFELDLGEILDVRSDTRIVLSGTGGLDLTLGFDFSQLAADLPGESGDIDLTTKLVDLGVRLKTQPAATADALPDTDFADDTNLKLELFSGGDTFEYTVTLPARNDVTVVDLAAELRQQFADVEVGSGFLSDIVTAGFQSGKLVITLIDETYSGLIVESEPSLGFTSNTASNLDDFIAVLSSGTEIGVDLSAQIGGGETFEDLDVADLFAALTAADGNLVGSIASDDPATAINEAGKSINIAYNVGPVKLDAILATNGSTVATDLGIVGVDLPFSAGNSGSLDAEVEDGVVEGLPIGGVAFSDRFFVTSDDLTEIATFDFTAQAGRLLTDLQLVGANDVLYSVSTDLRDFIGEEIELRDVNGFNNGTYKFANAVAVVVNDVATFGVEMTLTNDTPANLGQAGQAGGVGIVTTGVDATAALGFIGVELAGEANFGAEASIGFAAGFDGGDDTITLTEVLALFEPGSDLGVLDVFGLPELTLDTNMGDPEVMLTLRVAEGSDGFNAIAAQLGLDTAGVDVAIDIIALGDPLLKTRLGTFSNVTADSFEVTGDFTDLLAAEQTLRFTVPGDTLAEKGVFDVNIANVTSDGTTTVITLEGLADNAVVKSGLAAAPTDLSALSIENVVLLPSATVEVDSMLPIFDEGFGDFGIDEILAALRLLVDFLSEFESFEFMEQDIPVIDRSLKDLLGLADDLNDFIDELAANPAGSLQFLEDAVNDAIGLSSSTLARIYETVNGMAPVGDINAFEIGYDETENMLTFELNLGAEFSEAINVGFSDIGLGNLLEELGVDGLVNFSGSAGLEAEGGILMTLALGIDIDDTLAALNGEPDAGFDDAVFVLDDTNLEAVLNVAGRDLAFNAGLGPLALAIQNNGDDVAEIELNAGAEVSVSSNFSGRQSIANLISAGLGSDGGLFDISPANGAGSYGEVSGLLPVFFPTDANYIGAIKIGETALAGRGALEAFVTGSGIVFSTDTPVAGAASDGEQSIPADKFLVDVSEIVDFFENGFDFSEFSIFDNIRLAVDGFDRFLEILDENIFSALSDLSIPLVGPTFADAADFIGDFRDGFIGDFRAAIDAIEDAARDFTDPDENLISKLLFDLLGPEGLNLLLAIDPADQDSLVISEYISLNAAGLEDVLFNGADLEFADISWDFAIGQVLADVDANFDFDIGIPGLGLRSEGEVDFDLDWRLDLGFGLSTKEGFYLDVSDDSELEFNATVSPKDGSEITGTLGFLGLTAETATHAGMSVNGFDTDFGTGFTANFFLDIFDNVDGGASDDTDRLSITEISEIGLTFGADITAQAMLDLTLGLDDDLVGSAVAKGFPSLVADFDFLWEVDLAFDLIGNNLADGRDVSEDIGATLAEGLYYLAFNNVGLDVGSFLNDVLGPIVDAVAEYTEPLRPLIDFLTTPIPLIDVFGVELTMLDLAAQLGDFNPGIIEAIIEVLNLIDTVAELRAQGGTDALIVPFGSFVIFGDGETDNPFDGATSAALAATRDLEMLAGDFDAALQDLINNSGTSDKDKNAGKTVQKLSKPGGAFDFPIFNDPGQVFGLLLGEPAVLVTYDLEPLVVGFEQNFFFPILGPLGVSLGLVIEFTADFAFGYDTFGIQQFVETDFKNPLLILNGLYISDTENPDGSGADVPELTFLGGITAAAELNLGIARAGVAGGLFIEIMFDLFDPDDDGRVRITELVNNFVNQTRAPTGAEQALAPLAIFDVTGEIFARLFAFLKIDLGLFEIDKEWDFVPPITLFEFEIDFFRPPTVASESEGDLIINIGEFAEQRLLGDAFDFGETVFIEKAGVAGDEVTVNIWTDAGGFGADSPTSGNKFSFKMNTGGTILVRGGEGDDEINLIGWRGDEVLFDIEGGIGNDTIIFSGGAGVGTNTTSNRLIGGVGDDKIIGSGGRDLIVGGAGNDIVAGQGGDDLVIGDQVDFFGTTMVANPLGNDGDDTVLGGAGDDIVVAGGGQDEVLGDGSINPATHVVSDADTGADGDDLILGDGGDVTFLDLGQRILGNVLALHQGGVQGADGAGEGEADDIKAGGGNDIVFASGGNDRVEGNGGTDVIFGGLGFDTLIGNLGSDIIFGDTGEFLARLSDGSTDPTPVAMKSTMALNLSNTAEFSNQIKRLAIGPDGANDTIWGDNEEPAGGVTPTSTIPERRTDIEDGNNDFIFAGMGNDEVHAGGGNDYVTGGGGADGLFGDFGDDFIFGEGQGDFIDGGSGDDLLDGGTGPDVVFGRGGDDGIIASKGSDELNGGDGSDVYRVNLSGGNTTSFISIVDSDNDGDLPDDVEPDGDIDILEVNGTDRADRFLIRSDTAGDNAFIAGLNGAFNVERINYGKTLERIIVNGGAGDDIFASDDTAAEMTLNGEAGNDQFQIGQLFRTERNVNAEEGGIDTGIDAEDFFLTIEVTRGWLSNGISFPMTVNGGIGDDLFVVYHNKAVLTLNGESGDDIFEVRAFALAGSQEPQRERTDLTGGSGADTVRYSVNAPVNINGGDGFDTLIVIGTEFGDDFVITEDGVFGAGLNVNFVNIESLRVDGAEGDDRFFVQSTKETVFTELFGGLGDDTFNASGDTPPVVSNDLRGHSGIVTHDIESGDLRYDAQSLFGISANVGDNEIPFVVITESQGSTIVDEGDMIGDLYDIVLTRAPTRSVFVTVNAPLPSPGDRELGAYSFQVDRADGAAFSRVDSGSSVVLEFTTANWNEAQTVKVFAAGTADDNVARLFTRGDVTPEASLTFDYDDDAYEGQRNGVITHTFKASNDVTFTPALFTSVETVNDEVVSMTIFTTLSADEVLGRVVTISEGGGFGDFRFITGAEKVEGFPGFLKLTFQKPWDSTNNPDPTTTSFFIRLDDALVGLVDEVVETKAEEIFDDRSTLTAIEADGETAFNFGADDTLVGSVIEIIGGTGAGQQLLILENTSDRLTLNGIWNVDPADDSIFRIQQYDGLASQVVEVLVNDNDRPGLIVDQTISVDGAGVIIDGQETITAVIEGADGDVVGERDAFNLRLTTDLSGSQTVDVGLTYDSDQIIVSSTAGGEAIVEVTFDNTTNSGITLFVRAADDINREGAHTAKIDFSFAPGFGDPAETPVSDTTELDIPGTAEVSSVGTEFLPAGSATYPSGIVSVFDDGDELVEGVDFVLIDGSNTILFVEDGDVNSPIERSGIITINYEYIQPTYFTAFVQSLLVRIADDDAPTLLVRESDGSTDVVEGAGASSGVDFDTYDLVLTGEPTDSVEIDLTEIITKTTQTGGIRHDLVQVEIVEIIRTDKSGVVTQLFVAGTDPVADATDASGNPLVDSGGNPVTKFAITFDNTNWDQIVTVKIKAVDDNVTDGGDTKVFAPGPDTLAQILGPVYTDGAGGNGSLFGLGEPLLLPGEKNIKPADGDFGAGDIDNAESGAVVTVDRADITGAVLEDLRIYVDGEVPDGIDLLREATDNELEALVGKTLEIVGAPAAPNVVDQFRLIVGVEYTSTTVTFTLNAPYDLGTDEFGVINESFDPDQAVDNPNNAGFPADEDEPLINRYAITSESLNFFVNEEDSVDVLFVHDGDSPADSTGLLSSNRLSGFNMGPDILIGERQRQGGITFAELEVLDITLGTGYNELDIIGTPTNSTGGQTWTIVRTGDDVPYEPLNDLGVFGDLVTVNLSEEETELFTGAGYTAVNPEVSNDFITQVNVSGATVTGDMIGQLLRIFDGEMVVAERWIVGNTGNLLDVDAPLETLDGSGLTWAIVDPADGALSVDLQGGDDTLEGGASTKGFVAFGGAGADTITTGKGEDIVFGDDGRIDYIDGDGAIVTRLGVTPDVILGSAIGPFGDPFTLYTDQNIFPLADTSTGLVDDPFETGDTGLVGLFVDINNGTGALQEPRLITANTAGVLSISPEFSETLDLTSDFRISTLPEDQTDFAVWGPSIILAVANAGGAGDTISTGEGDDIAMGGEGDDDITLGTSAAAQDDDIGFGDLGLLRNVFPEGSNFDPEPGEFVPTVRDGIYSIQLGIGGNDTVRGNAGDDVIIGGAGMDSLYGDDESATAGANDGVDDILGDGGFLKYDEGVLERIETYKTNGDDDLIEGGASGDRILGGLGGDTIFGDSRGTGPGTGDLILGDNGVVLFDTASGSSVLTDVYTTETTLGGADTISGDEGDDLILGGADGDLIHGNSGNDIILGDFGRVEFVDDVARYAVTTDIDEGGADTIYGDADEDVLVGGAFSDVIDGDADRDLIFGDNVALDRRDADDFLDFTDPRHRELTGAGVLYGDGLTTGPEGEALVDDTDQLAPGTAPIWRNWEIEILAHLPGALAATAGDDYIAGGGDDDMIFGQLGNDVIQGDGSIDSLVDETSPVGASRMANGSLLLNASFEAASDGDDYIEGNGGDDVVFGNLGQDDIVGDNSDFYSLDFDERALVGADMIFGGAGTQVDRNQYVDDEFIALTDRHARDADMVMGDNGNIFRLVTGDTSTINDDTDTQYLSFVYDTLDDLLSPAYPGGDANDRSEAGERIVVRSAQMLDYDFGGTDVDPAALNRGMGDEIHGESGDDFLYGLTGDDIIFGDSEDDDIIGGIGNDWISGGTGQDGVIGGDGRIWTSKNTADPALTEVLYNIGTVAVNEFISTPGKIQQSTIHIDGALKKTADLTPFYNDDANQQTKVDDTSTNDNDIIFGGWGSDFLHGGFGDDAISGAEALASEVDLLPFSFHNPGNPGDILNFGADGRPNEFAAYDEFNPRPEVWVDPTNGYVFTDPANPNAVPFVLNFQADDGDAITTDGVATHSDGADVIFGDLGNDWLVGGTGTDRMYGGFGNDLLNADDDHSRVDGQNQQPDTDDSYADIAYGGGGRDVLIANTGGDRLIDWVGEFNSYIVPFAPFGAFTVSRNVQPQLYEYLYDLSEADGADPTRVIDGNPDRNGEPFGEIGAVKQQDPFWQDQTGAPDDPQPGNIPGGKRDIMAAEDFNEFDATSVNNVLLGFAADTGNWAASAGQLSIAPDTLGQDAVSVYHVQGYLPVYFEMVADIVAEKERAGYDSNAYMIFDYYGPDDFKFAGIDQDTNKLVVGHRDASGWHVDEKKSMRIAPDKAYNLMIAVNGTTVTVVLGNKYLSHTYAPRMDDGIPQPISKGLIGFGADNSRTRIDNFAIQVLPPDLTYESEEDFKQGELGNLTGETQGILNVQSNQLNVSPGTDGIGFALLDLANDAGLPAGSYQMDANSKVQLNVDVDGDATAGLIFDYVSDDRFKFAAIDALTGEVVIGHKAGGRIVIDASTSTSLADAEMSLLIAGSTVSVNLDGAFVLSHSFNAVSVDGQFGVLTIGGDAVFDNLKIATDDPAIARDEEPMTATYYGSGGSTLTQEDMEATVDAAILRLAEEYDLTDAEIASLNQVTLEIADLDGNTLAETDGETIVFDIDAAGHGFFVDETPLLNEEFDEKGLATDEGGADGMMDLMTVAMHELGHVLGFDHTSDDSFMNAMLDPSTRLGLFEEPANTNGPTDASTDDSGEVLIYDDRVQGMISEDEAMLLDTVWGDQEEVSASPSKGSKKPVKWAAE